MVPKTLSDRDAVVQFEAAMFPAVSEIQLGRLTGSAALEFQVQARNSAALRSPREMATGKRIPLRGVSLVGLSSKGEIAE